MREVSKAGNGLNDDLITIILRMSLQTHYSQV